MDDINVYSIPGFREPFSCLSHLVAAPLFAILGYFLIQRGRGRWGRTFSLFVMVVTTVFLLSMSGVYHLLSPGGGRAVMLHLDVAGVFALIAGTVTPVQVILFRGLSRWGPLVLIWSAAATGITLRTIFSSSLPEFVGTGIFLLLGWSGVISCFVLWRRYGYLFVKPLIWGGVAYTLGAVVLELNWPVLIPGVVGPHELWHVAVLAGLGFHWNFVFRFVSDLPQLDPE